MKRFVLTGATGHLGNVVAKELVAKGYTVKALLLPNEDLTPIRDLYLEIAYGDVRDKNFLMANIQSEEIVIHMAGIIDVSSKKNELLMDVNVNGTKNVAKVCMAKKARLVYISSVHIIDPIKDTILTEPIVLDENRINGNYAKSKTIATKYIFQECRKGLNASVVFPSGIIGPFDYKISNVGQVIIDHMKGKLLARVKGGYNFVDVRDVAAGVIVAAEKGKVGEGYILSGEQFSVKDLILAINEKTGKTKVPPKIALWFAKLMAPLSEMYYIAKKQKPSFSTYALQTLQDNCNFSHAKATEELGFSSRPAKQSIFDAVQWFLDNKNGG